MSGGVGCEASAQQPGLPPSTVERASFAEPGTLVDLNGAARLPGPMLRMLDRVTGYWPDAGPAGLGRRPAGYPKN
jgi:hypothetical protein